MAAKANKVNKAKGRRNPKNEAASTGKATGVIVHFTVPAEKHREIKTAAVRSGVSLQAFMIDASYAEAERVLAK